MGDARAVVTALAAVLALLAGAPAGAAEGPRITGGRVLPPDRIQVAVTGALDLGSVRVSRADAPDVPLPVRSAVAAPAGRVTLTLDRTLDPAGAYRVEIGRPPVSYDVRPSPWTLLLTVVLGAALINNFVFTRYLGLCIFFGVSKRRDTALGMGVTFTAVMIGTGMASWLLYRFVLMPLQLRFLQVLVFIGVVAFVVQLLDTVLKKTHRALHQRFGIYLMLITTNCIILAVPLLNAAAGSGGLESFALAMGSGFGFALALFLMSCARERVELAKVPDSFQGLPIAFALAGLFALAFMGFSGLTFFR